MLSSGGGRLRIDDEFQGLGPPLHEDHTLATVGVVQGSKLVLEAGAPPTSSEVCFVTQQWRNAHSYPILLHPLPPVDQSTVSGIPSQATGQTH